MATRDSLAERKRDCIAIDTMEDFKRRDVIRDISKIKIKSVNS